MSFCRQIPKVDVEGSSPFARSGVIKIAIWLRSLSDSVETILKSVDTISHRKHSWSLECDIIVDRLSALPWLKTVLDDGWVREVRNAIDLLSEPMNVPKELQLLRLFRDEPSLLNQLDAYGTTLEPEAKQTNRMRPFKDTTTKLKSHQINQVFGAIFELTILYRFITTCKPIGAVCEMYAPLLQGKGNTDLRIGVGGRCISIEAKALGYSDHDVLGRPGLFYHSEQSQSKQLGDALDQKGGRGRQLSITGAREPTLLCLSLFANETIDMAIIHLNEYFSRSEGIPSAVLVYGSYRCAMSPKLVLNAIARVPLLAREQALVLSAGSGVNHV